MIEALPSVLEQERIQSPAPAPQALTWRHGELWMGSRDLSRIYRMEKEGWRVREELGAPGIPWAMISVGDALWFTLGEGIDDDRYLWRYEPGQGFIERERIPCPD